MADTEQQTEQVPATPKSPLRSKYAAVWQWALWNIRKKNVAGRPPLDLESPGDQ
jgi:hypothetical protein